MNKARVKDVARINRSTLPETTDPGFRFKYIDISAVDSLGQITIPSEDSTFANSPSRARRIAPAGAVVVSTVRTYLRAIASVPDTEQSLVFSTGFAVLEARPQVANRFLGYHCQSQPFIDEIVSRSTGVSYPAINPAELGNLRITLPPLAEQRRIADFLDAETTRIDQLERLRNRQEELFGERCTLALDNAFRSPESRPTRLKYLLTQRPRYGVLVPRFSDSGVRFIRVNDLLDLVGRADSLPKIPQELSAQYTRTVTREGDVLLSVVGTMGRSAVVPRDLAGANVARAVASLRTNPKIPPRLVAAWLTTPSFLRQAQHATGSDTAQPTLGMEDLSNFRLSWPVDKQAQDDLLLKTSRIRRHQQEATKLFAKQRQVLSERRQALITAAVTGKFDVSTASGRNVTDGIGA